MIKTYPFYVRSTIILFGLLLLVYTLLALREILVPLAFALLLSTLLHPATAWLQRKGVPRVAAITIAIVSAIIVMAAIAWFLFMEVSNFTSQLPGFKHKTAQLFTQLQQLVAQQLGVSIHQQRQYVEQAEAGLRPMAAALMGTAMGTLAMIVLLPVYTFLFLFYKELLLTFVYEVFAEQNEKEIGTVLVQTKGAIQSYMFGLLLEALIVAALNTAALLVLRVPYAVLLGILGAILNILPFIGGITAVLLPLLIAVLTKNGFQTELWIIVAYAVIQFVDNHFLVPYIVASRVKVNALVSIVIVLMGAALWGVPGMFLSIPFAGVLKIIFDRVDGLKPWGKLIGVETATRRRRFPGRRTSTSKQ